MIFLPSRHTLWLSNFSNRFFLVAKYDIIFLRVAVFETESIYKEIEAQYLFLLSHSHSSISEPTVWFWYFALLLYILVCTHCLVLVFCPYIVIHLSRYSLSCSDVSSVLLYISCSLYSLSGSGVLSVLPYIRVCTHCLVLVFCP